MKLVKMSLVAAMLMGASAFAMDNTKVSGDAKVFYGTDDSNDADLFSKEGAYAQAALGLGVTTDLMEGVSAGAHLTALSTLGLQGQLVSGVWEATNGVDDYWWFDEAWIAATLGKTTLKAGRMALDTPLVFSEQWSIAQNTFEGAVLLNQDLPDTTLVAAYVGGGNGWNDSWVQNTQYGGGWVVGPVNENGTTNFGQFWHIPRTNTGGAYAFGIVNNSWKPLTLQGWYYDATRVIQAYWLQADLNMEGIILGAQYTGQKLQDYTADLLGADNPDQSAYALKVGYENDTFSLSGAYSATNDKGPIPVGANLAGYGQTKLYTEAWWNYGYVTMVDTTAFNIAGTVNVGSVGLEAYYTSTTTNEGMPNGDDLNMNELTLGVSKSFGALDTGLYYISTDADDQNDGDAYNTVQVYLTLNF